MRTGVRNVNVYWVCRMDIAKPIPADKITSALSRRLEIHEYFVRFRRLESTAFNGVDLHGQFPEKPVHYSNGKGPAVPEAFFEQPTTADQPSGGTRLSHGARCSDDGRRSIGRRQYTGAGHFLPLDSNRAIERDFDSGSDLETDIGPSGQNAD